MHPHLQVAEVEAVVATEESRRRHNPVRQFPLSCRLGEHHASPDFELEMGPGARVAVPPL